MNLTRLKYFVKIVDIGSLTQAAEVLFIAQPALSQQLATLEGELKQQLLIRTKRGVTPTEAGKILYAHAQVILRQCEQAMGDVLASSKALTGKVSVGLAPGTAASTLSWPLLKRVREQHPGIVLYLNENFGTTLSELIMSGRMDMGVLYGDKVIHGLSFEPLAKEPLYLVSSPKRDLPSVDVSLKDIAQWDLLMPRTYNVVRKLVDEACLGIGVTLNVIAEIESSTTLSAAIENDLGVTILPKSAAMALSKQTEAKLYRIVSPIVEAPLALCLSDHLPLSIPAQAVKDILLELVAELLPKPALSEEKTQNMALA
ncbi:nitrogen assimilation transcriptional regulator NAC [Marinomonas transparens]|uniref:Nitrogen assimilation transcriptional regulator NAC n=1 Tax=Marinomonas transparens TaxID=2795388 RepID=A0A934JQ41_9GAMM|nr:nitrogen assimilation transcriptional regulator NAC [Marinomonas transparens]MBJ7538618.1 nitrogen assimilation transcriptional regulator NAC [Marinomonas transparens]